MAVPSAYAPGAGATPGFCVDVPLHNLLIKSSLRRVIARPVESGCRVLALMGGDPLLRPQFVHKIVYYAAKKGFWI